MCARDGAHEQDDRHHHQPRCDDGRGETDLPLRVKQPTTSCGQHEHESSKCLREQPAVLEPRVVEVRARAELEHQQPMSSRHIMVADRYLPRLRRARVGHAGTVCVAPDASAARLQRAGAARPGGPADAQARNRRQTLLRWPSPGGLRRPSLSLAFRAKAGAAAPLVRAKRAETVRGATNDVRARRTVVSLRSGRWTDAPQRQSARRWPR